LALGLLGAVDARKIATQCAQFKLIADNCELFKKKAPFNAPSEWWECYTAAATVDLSGTIALPEQFVVLCN